MSHCRAGGVAGSLSGPQESGQVFLTLRQLPPLGTKGARPSQSPPWTRRTQLLRQDLTLPTTGAVLCLHWMDSRTSPTCPAGPCHGLQLPRDAEEGTTPAPGFEHWEISQKSPTPERSGWWWVGRRTCLEGVHSPLPSVLLCPPSSRPQQGASPHPSPSQTMSLPGSHREAAVPLKTPYPPGPRLAQAWPGLA